MILLYHLNMVVHRSKRMANPKPPLGLRPRTIADRERFMEVSKAIYRYFNTTQLPIPIEWVEEWNELLLRGKGK